MHAHPELEDKTPWLLSSQAIKPAELDAGSRPSATHVFYMSPAAVGYKEWLDRSQDRSSAASSIKKESAGSRRQTAKYAVLFSLVQKDTSGGESQIITKQQIQ